MSRKTKRTIKTDVLFILDSGNIEKETHKAFQDLIEDICFNMQISDRTALLRFGCICYHMLSSNDIKIFDFDKEIENLVNFLEDISPNEKCNEQTSFVQILNESFKLSWRDGKKIIIWFAKNACIDEKQKRIKLFQNLFKDGYYFIGISIGKHVNKAFEEIGDIFKSSKDEESRILTI